MQPLRAGPDLAEDGERLGDTLGVGGEQGVIGCQLGDQADRDVILCQDLQHALCVLVPFESLEPLEWRLPTDD